MPIRVYCTVLVILLLPSLVGCGKPTLDVRSDAAYTESLVEIRSSLSSDEQREFLGIMLTQLRAWHEPEYDELLAIESPTAAQLQQLEELELRHKLKTHELLHEKDVDGIAVAFRDYVLVNLDDHLDWLTKRIDSIHALQKVTGELLHIGEFQSRVPGYLSRSHQVRLENSGDHSVAGVVSLECLPVEEWECKGEACEPYVIDLRGGLDEPLEPGDSQTVDTFELIEESEFQPSSDLLSIFSDWRCWTTSATMSDEFDTCCFRERPDAAIDSIRRSLAESEAEGEAIALLSGFDESFEYWRQKKAHHM